jgi:predicted CopG family antitoxin
MKQINVWFDDEEHKELVEIKKELSWHDFIMSLVKKEKKQ